MVNNITGAGTLYLEVCDEDDVKDSVGNPLGGVGEENDNYTDINAVYEIDARDVTNITCIVSPVDMEKGVSVGSPPEISGQITDKEARSHCYR